MRAISSPASAPAFSKRPKSVKPKIRDNHPPVSNMSKASMNAGKDRKGTSHPAIRKIVAVKYKVDVEILGPHIRRGIVNAIATGVLVRVGNTGKGASGTLEVAETKAAVARPKANPKHKRLKTAAPKKVKATKRPRPKTFEVAGPQEAKAVRHTQEGQDAQEASG